LLLRTLPEVFLLLRTLPEVEAECYSKHSMGKNAYGQRRSPSELLHQVNWTSKC
jgi:hypothetical protein